MKSQAIQVISNLTGWLYFLAWSVSFYPQIYVNWKRKSVIGLNFDLVALNIYGFVVYSMFNCGLYWMQPIQDEYMRRHPLGMNPVEISDVFFSVHASIATIVIINQCIRYERGKQRVSGFIRGVMSIFSATLLVWASCSVAQYIHWLDFLYCCSYIKLIITLIKYVPQAYMNYNRKSTVGWSITAVLLDFTGGFLSIFEMILNGYNYNDWDSFFGNFTKFGLGLFSLSFDILFMLQHYVLYKNVRDFVRLDNKQDISDDETEYFIQDMDRIDDVIRYNKETKNNNKT